MIIKKIRTYGLSEETVSKFLTKACETLSDMNENSLINIQCAYKKCDNLISCICIPMRFDLFPF